MIDSDFAFHVDSAANELRNPHDHGPAAARPGQSRRNGHTEAETRALLTRMVERGWMQARGDGKGRTWHLSAAVYRVLDAPAGYVRVRGFEPLQQEQMILQFVEAHGSRPEPSD